MREKTIAMILAVDEENGLGKANSLAWKLKGDMQYFREITTTTLSSSKQNAVIMGRKTWESIPEKFRPLPNRKNYILTKDETFVGGDGVFHTLEDAISSLSNDDFVETIYIIGGSQIYNEAIKKDIPDTLYLTQVLGHFGCDVFFLGVPNNYSLESIGEKQEENGVQYQFLVYQKDHNRNPLTSGKPLWEGEAPSVSQVGEN